MNEIKYRNWIFEVDQLKTKSIYNEIKSSGSENCSCADCKKYQKQKDIVFPEEIKELLKKLGIDYKKEVEVCHLYRREDGYHQYNGWFHFIGKIKKNNKKNVIELKFKAITDDFGLLFNENRDIANKKFINYPLVQMEYTTFIPWVIKEKESE